MTKSHENTFQKKTRVFIIILSTFLLCLALRAAEGASIRLLDSKTQKRDLTINAGEILDLDIVVSGGAQKLGGVSVFLSFQSAYFEVIDIDSRKEGIQPVEGGPFGNIWMEFRNVTQGNQIDYARMTMNIEQSVSGEGVLGTIHLRALKGTDFTKITFDSSGNRETTYMYVDEDEERFATSNFGMAVPAEITIESKQVPVITPISNIIMLIGKPVPSINLDDYMADPDNIDKEITWTIEGGGHITPHINHSSHVLTFDPIVDWFGVEDFTLTATDPGGNFATSNVRVAVKATPKVSDISDITLKAGSSNTSIDLDDYVSDLDGQKTDIRWTYQGSQNVQVSISADNAVTFTSLDTWSGSETITFIATDADGYEGRDDVIVTVLPKDEPTSQPPVIGNLPPMTLIMGEIKVGFDLDDYVSDDSTPLADLTWQAKNYDSNHIEVLIRADHVTTFVASDTWHGVENVTFTVTDSEGNTASADVTATIKEEQEPTFFPPSVMLPKSITLTEGDTDTSLDLDNHVTDSDNNPEEISWKASDYSIITVILNATSHQVIIYAPEGSAGTQSITFTATDPDGNTASADVTVTIREKQGPASFSPTVTLPASLTITEGDTDTSLDLDDYVTDPDNPPSELFWIPSGHSGIIVDIDGVSHKVTIHAPEGSVGTQNITFTAYDPDGNSGSADVTLTIEEKQAPTSFPPTVTLPAGLTLTEGDIDTSLDLDDYVTDLDNPPNELFWIPGGYSGIIVDIDGVSHKVTIHAPEGSVGTQNITFTAYDPDGNSGNDDITLTIEEKQAPPSFPPTVTLPVGLTIIEGDTGTSLDLDDYVTDPDNPPSELFWISSGYSGIIVDIDGVSHKVTIHAPEGSAGTQNITFTATDPDGNAGSANLIVTIEEKVGTPVVKNIPDITILKNGQDTSINLDQYVTDEDGLIQTLTWKATGATDITVEIDLATHVVTLTPKEDWVGKEKITFQATDLDGNEGSDEIVVAVIDNSPIITDIPNIILKVGKTKTFNLDDYVSDKDTLKEDIIWDAWDYISIDVEIDDDTHLVTVTAPDYVVDPEEITFTATDPEDNSNSYTIIVTVEPLPSPVITDIPDITLKVDETKTFNLDNHVTDEDTPKENITWEVWDYISIDVGMDPDTHEVTVTAPDYVVDPEEITFTATDPEDNSDNYTITVTVEPPSTPPPVVTDIPDITLKAGETHTFDLDDHVTDEDTPEGDIIWNASGEILIEVGINENTHEVTVTAPDDFSSSENIIFTATDPEGNLDSYTITVTVEPPSSSPLPVVTDIPNITISVEKFDISIDLDDYVTDDDTPKENLTWVASESTSIEIAIDDKTHQVILKGKTVGTEEITFTATDPEGNMDSGSVKITVEGESNGGEDTTPPAFEVFVMRNPIQPDYIVITVTSSETLEDKPTLIVQLDGKKEEVTLSEGSVNTWTGTYIVQVDASGEAVIIVTGIDAAGNTGTNDTKTFAVNKGDETDIREPLLLQNYPNPFNPETWIPYLLKDSADVNIYIYNTAGQLVQTLNIGDRKPGRYVTKNDAAYWNGRNNNGEQVTNGVYFYSIKAGNFTATKKMLIRKINEFSQ